MPDVPATRGVVCIVAPKFNGPLRASVHWRIAPTPPEWRPGGCGLLLFPHGGLQATSHPRHGVGSVLSGPVRPGSLGGRFARDGVYFGASSLFLAKRIRRSGKRIRLVCVDTWAAKDAEWLLLQRRQDRDEANRFNGSVFLAFWHHVQERGLANIITPLMMASAEAAALFSERSVDLVFIDTDHSYMVVAQDIRAWTPNVRDGGPLAGHDYALGFPGVVMAVDEQCPGAVSSPPSSWRFQVRRDV